MRLFVSWIWDFFLTHVRFYYFVIHAGILELQPFSILYLYICFIFVKKCSYLVFNIHILYLLSQLNLNPIDWCIFRHLSPQFKRVLLKETHQFPCWGLNNLEIQKNREY